MKPKFGRDRQELLDSKRNREKQNDAEIQGEITGAIYRNGPISSRSCTDATFCVLYVMFLLLLLTITIIASLDGNVKYLYTGYDTDNGACGVGERTDYPYLYFLTPKTNISSTVCVSQCPTQKSVNLTCFQNSAVKDCSNVSKIYATTEDNYNVVCLPTDETLYSDVSGSLSLGYWTDFKQIVLDNALIYLTALVFSYLLASILLLLMLFFPKCIAWTFITLSITLLIVAATLFMILYADPDLITTSFSTNAISDDLKLAISITLYVISLIAIIYMIFKMKKIRGALAFMETTSLYIKQIWTSLILPITFLLIFWIYLLYAGYYCLLIFTIGDVSRDTDSTFGLIWPNIEGCVFLIIHLIGTYFNLAIIICTYLFLLNGSCCYWYFSTPTSISSVSVSDKANANAEENKKNTSSITTSKVPKVYPLMEAIKIFFKYHIGSVVVGSILMAMFSWFNYLFSHLYNKFVAWRDYSEEKTFKRYLLTGLLLLFYLYEKFIRYISRNSFSQMTITGSNFYQSTKDAFYLVQRNHKSYYPVQGLGDFIIFLGQLLIILTTTIGSFFVLLELFDEELSTSMEVCIIVFFIAFCSSNVIMLIYSAVNDAVLMNYLLDVEIEINNYGKSEPYHAPAPLKAFLSDPQNQKNLFS